MASESVPPAIDTLISREEIRDCICRSALANDLCDADIWKSVYWPDGHEDCGYYKGNAHSFIEKIKPLLLFATDITWHHVSNTTIRFDTTELASAVSYVFIYCRMLEKTGDRRDLLTGARYLDRLERRCSEWRIYERVTRTDWIREYPDTHSRNCGDLDSEELCTASVRSLIDPLSNFFRPDALHGWSFHSRDMSHSGPVA